MSLDFLSGLLLAAVVVGGLIYIVKEWFGLAMPTFAAAERAERPGGANSHLIGAVGRIVDAGQDSGDMLVRIGMERWNARLRSPAGGRLPVGTEVEIKAVDGFVLEVEEKPAAAAAPGGQTG